jgi:hypothetical protein
VAGAAGGFSPRGDETPEQILKRRYAKGEMERDEYQRRLEDPKGKPSQKINVKLITYRAS